MLIAQKSSFWKMFRVTILLLILLIVAVNAWRDYHQNWQTPIFVALYPVNADQSTVTADYIASLNEQDFAVIAHYLQQQAQQYHQPIHVYFKLGSEIKTLPPKVPDSQSILEIMWWSLRFRYYAWRQQQDIGIRPQLRLFLNYYDMRTHQVLKHSTALQNGRIGVVNLFAHHKQDSQNQIVIAHEMLHAFGATDKYDLSTGQPVYPQGLGDPDQQPLYPQKTAELMAGHIALSATKSKMANSLKDVRINAETAREIGWLK
ncbi:hypothetical protein GCM10023206_28940 [Acinetobacter puyangensis]|uniref:Uncharacterized protein n=1 Tax=Acinetobacter puyangensis TaxID=1096779 RepID=A0A240E3J4_9GAMM|nr:hypothetical protein [Acinetobacter puyangensis]SNX43338.1 hypothetical protein SAMN05421731_101374 [Acinetobacter puyangensis]